MRIISVAFVFTACASSGTHSDGPSNAGLKAATYTAATDVGNDEDGPVAATDCLTIRPAADGAVAYEFFFAFPYDHACSMQGTAVPVGAGVWEETRDDCHLRLTWAHGAWSVDDPDSTCRVENCGARGSIGHVFQTESAAPPRACQ